jgi:hypothetical protein
MDIKAKGVIIRSNDTKQIKLGKVMRHSDGDESIMVADIGVVARQSTATTILTQEGVNKVYM